MTTSDAHRDTTARPRPIAARSRVLALVALLGVVAAPAVAQRARPSFNGAPLTTERATQIAGAAAYELIGVNRCLRPRPGCAVFAVRAPSGLTHIYEVADQACPSRTAPAATGTSARLSG